MNPLLKFALTEAIKAEPAILAELSKMVEEASANLLQSAAAVPDPVAAAGEVIHFDPVTKQQIPAPVFPAAAPAAAPEVVAAAESALEGSTAPAAAPVVAPVPAAAPALGTNVKIH